MVNIINETIFNGLAGRRPTEAPRYYILHNDAGSMTPEAYINWLRDRYNAGLSDRGYAHYYISRNTIARVEDTYNGTWSTANPEGNLYSLGYEVVQQFGTTDAEFLENEDMTLRQMAEDMKYYGATPNEDNIVFHNEFVATSCPARSLALHGNSNESLRRYVIEKIKYYQSLGNTVEEMLQADAGNYEGWQKNSKGWWYREANGSYPANKWRKVGNEWFYFEADGYCVLNRWIKLNEKWYYLNVRGAMVTGWFMVGNSWYYFKEDGTMATGWVKYKDKWYYLNTNNGFMESNQFIKSGEGWYYVDEDGTMAERPEFTVEPNGLITKKKEEIEENKEDKKA